MRKSNNDSVQTVKRSYRRFIVGLTALAVSATICAQDFTRLSERTIMGTARYVGMAGAMSAIGGDPSAVRDNPAGLGLYRRTEVLVSLDFATYEGGIVTVPQASWEFSIPTNKLKEAGVLFHNFMFSYNRLHTYDHTYVCEGENDLSLGDKLSQLKDVNWGDFQFCKDIYNSYNRTQVIESGMIHEFAFNWGMNVSNTWYVGAGLRVQSYVLHSSGLYQEDFDRKNSAGKNMYLDNSTNLYFNGAGCSAALGLIYRPISWVRLGLGIETPSFGGINVRWNGELEALTDTIMKLSFPTQYSIIKDYHQPFRTTVSAALQVGAYGLLAFQYDYRHAYYMDDIHTLKAGIEFIPIMGLYVNLGYVYESTFKPYKSTLMDETFLRQDTYSFYPRVSQYASAAFGYRGAHMIIQAAYQFHWKQTAFYPLDDVAPFDVYNTTHRVVLTLGWHRD